MAADSLLSDVLRASFHLENLLHSACSKAGVSKRAAAVLSYVDAAPRKLVATAELVKDFRNSGISTPSSSPKDVSLAKMELFKRDLIEARGAPRNVGLTKSGLECIQMLSALISQRLKTFQEAGAVLSIGMETKDAQTLRPGKKPASSERTGDLREAVNSRRREFT